MPGTLGVALRDPHGESESAFMPADKKLGFVSGVDILSNGGALSPPRTSLSQLLDRLCWRVGVQLFE